MLRQIPGLRRRSGHWLVG